MLEAQCSLAPEGKGDIIVLALPGHPWGEKDKKNLFVVEWDDQEKEDVLIARQKQGEPWPVLTTPYKVMKQEGPVLRMVLRSTEAVDIEALDASTKVAILDPSVKVDTISLEDYSVITKSAPSEGIISTVVNAFKSAWNWLVS